jgi:hypothetical protein
MRKLAVPVALSIAVLSIHSGGRVGSGWANFSSGLSGAVPGVNPLVTDPVTGTCVYALTSSGRARYPIIRTSCIWGPRATACSRVATAAPPGPLSRIA